ncbi:MAG TPA: hypothetical protein DCY86_03015 [Bdellovibrionales bacterium]|nr:hypothetical protein [Bdellovibrionales bacterium]
MAAYISGSVTIGESCYFGKNYSVINNISIAPNTIVGAGACVVSNIKESGTYVGKAAIKK